MKGMEKSGEGSEGDSDVSDAIAAQVLTQLDLGILVRNGIDFYSIWE